MASDATGTKSVTNTLSTTTADLITLQGIWDGVEIHNHDATNMLYVRFDGTAPVAEANETETVPPASAKTFWPMLVGPTANLGHHVIRVVGDGGKYTVTGIAGRP